MDIATLTGALPSYRGDEELRVSNERLSGLSSLTLLAFLAPPFSPCAAS